MFPRAHAVSYGIADLQMAWFKLYHPEAFYAVYWADAADNVEATDFRMDTTRLRRAILSLRAEAEDDDPEQDDFTFDRLGRQRALETILEMRCRGIEMENVEKTLTEEK